MNRRLFIFAVQLVAFWPVWRWYTARIGDSTDQSWGLVALATAMFFVVGKKGPGRLIESSLKAPTLLVLLYAVTYHVFPPLGRAAVAFAAIGMTLSLFRFGKPFHPGVLGLLALALPLISSLQFYGGYPLRVLVASLTAPILRLGGFAVVQEGTCLNWAGQLIWIDAPCSGIRMLWVGLYLAFALVSLFELRLWKTVALITVAFFAIIAGNIFRAVALFYFESGVIPMPGWAHDYAGLVAFALVAASIVTAVLFLRVRVESGLVRCVETSALSKPTPARAGQQFIRREKTCGEQPST